MNILILYASLQGQTAKISEHIAQMLRVDSHHADALDVQALPTGFKLESYDAAILGGSIHLGHYPKYLKTFIKQHQAWLNTHPSALFTVCMAINSKQIESRHEAENFGKLLSSETGWQPALTATFAGAVKYTQYGFFTRLIMKNISRREGGSTDTSRDHEYTDWDAVDRFTNLISREFSR